MYFQYVLHLHACNPQVLVRYALVFAALFALFVVAINAGKIVRIAMSVCIGLVSLIGATLAAHQSWPRHVPLVLAKIGVNIDSVVRALPLGDVLPKFFLGAGGCDKARWTIVGIVGSEWAYLLDFPAIHFVRKFAHALPCSAKPPRHFLVPHSARQQVPSGLLRRGNGRLYLQHLYASFARFGCAVPVYVSH